MNEIKLKEKMMYCTSIMIASIAAYAVGCLKSKIIGNEKCVIDEM